MPTANQSRPSKPGRPPTNTTLEFTTGTSTSTTVPDPDPGVVDVVEITAAEMTQVLDFFDGLSLTYGGNLTPTEIQSNVADDTPGRLSGELGAAWGTLVNDSEAVQGGWGQSAAIWVHPKKDGKVVYTYDGTNYASATIKVERTS